MPEVEVLQPHSGEKQCCTCGIWKPLTGFYFQKDRHADDGWCPKCKECRKKYREQERNKEIAKKVRTIEHGILKKIASGQGRQPLCDLVTGSETILDAFGGIEGFAEKLALDYEATTAGTPARVKLLMGALAFVAKGMEKREPVELGGMSDEELQVLLAKALGSEQGRLTDESEDSTAVGESE